MPKTKKLIAVVTAYAKKFDSYAQENASLEKEFHCVMGLKDLRGRYFDEVVYLYKWQDLEDWFLIEQELPTRMRN